MFRLLINLVLLTLGPSGKSLSSTENAPLMLSESYQATITVLQDPATVYAACRNFRAWWSEDIEGPTDEAGQSFLYHYKDIHISKMKLVEAIPDRRLVYEVLENHFSFVEDQTEWKDTRLIFDIVPEGGATRVTFTHEGLLPRHECFNVCNEAWTNYIQKSLYDLITTGEGHPNPRDTEGFNAELTRKWSLE